MKVLTMKTRQWIIAATLMICGASEVQAYDYEGMKPLKLQTPEMKPELVTTDRSRTLSLDLSAPTEDKWAPDFNFFKTKTNPGVKPYKFMDDMTFVGVPLFIAGWAIKGDKAMFRVNQKDARRNTQLLNDFKTGIDDYTQFFGPVMTAGMKLGGYEGRSDWPRLLASAGMSYAIMAAFVNGIKYTAKEMRPDGSTANSWPSGHTATSFVGATLLHKEYGLTRSPWFSVAGYGVATATGVMRVLNNRHWVSDVMSGAGIGIVSTELGYALCDLLFKGKGLLRNDLVSDSDKPSFFSISMGLGLGSKSIDFETTDLVGYEEWSDENLSIEEEKEQIKFRAATVVDAEGAYFLNKYFGIGGRFRVRAMSAKSFGSYSDYVKIEDLNAWQYLEDLYSLNDPNFNSDAYLNRIGYNESTFEQTAPVTEINGVVKSDHLTEFTGSAGFYFNLPLGGGFALGTKALIGRSITQELDIDGHAKGNVKDIDYEMTIKNGDFAQDANGNYLAHFDYPKNTGETFEDEWDYLTVGASNSTSWGTGLSLTYRYKSNFSWKLFCDYDYTEKDFTLTYNPFHFLYKGLSDNALGLMQLLMTDTEVFRPVEYKKKKKMNYVTVGLSFSVNF